MTQLLLIYMQILYWFTQSATWLVFPLLFYWSFPVSASCGRSLLLIMTKPHEGMSIKSWTCNIDQTKRYSLWDRFKVLWNYEVHGAYAHLDQQTVQDLVDTMNSALEYLHYIDDPLCLQFPYEYLKERIKKTTDWLIARQFSIVAIASCFAIPILKDLYWFFWIILISRKAKAKY